MTDKTEPAGKESVGIRHSGVSETTRHHAKSPKIKRPSIIISAASNWIVIFLHAGIYLVLTPYILSHIHKDGFGKWTMMSTIVGYYGLLRLGIGTATMRYVSLYDGKGSSIDVNGTFSTAMTMYTCVGGIIVAISTLGANLIASFFHQGHDFVHLIIISGITAALGCPSAALEATLRAREQFVIANALMLALTLLRSMGLAAVLWLGFGLNGMAFVAMGLSIIDLSIMIMIFRKVCPDISLDLKEISYSHFKYLISFGLMAVLVSLGLSLRFDTDRTIIGRTLDMATVGTYAIPISLLAQFRQIMRAAGRVLTPRFSFLDGVGSREQTLSLFLRSSRFVALFASGIGAGIAVAGPSFIRVWVGRGFETALAALVVLAIAYTIGQSQMSAFSFLNGIGKQGTVAFITILEGLCSIGLCILFAPKLRLTGIALGISIPMVIVNAIVFPVYMARYFRISLLQFYWDCFLRAWICAAMTVACGVVFLHFFSARGWPRFFVFACFTGLVYLIFAYKIGLTRPERVSAVRKINSKLGRFGLFKSKPATLTE
jgi:O-antigen/teichoic acid export membrane protein